MTSIEERIAGGALVSVLGGFFIAVTLGPSVNRAVVMWLLTVVCCGVVIGGTEKLPRGQVLKAAAFPAFVLSITPVLYFYLLAILAFIENPYPERLELAWGQVDVRVAPLNPLVIVGIVVLWAACFAGSLLMVSLAVVGSRVILVWAQEFYKFGPKGFTRLKLLILSVGAVIGAISSVLAVLSQRAA